MNLPNFLIVGAAKSGTTSLHYYLNQHPDVFFPPIKETYFLTGMRRSDFPTYFSSPVIEDLANYSELYREAIDSTAKGEACVAYLSHFERTIPRIKEYLENPRVIIILRNPVDRAYSHYLELRMQGIEELAFEEAIWEESRRMAEGQWWWSSQYINIGRYADQVEAYLNAFGCDRVAIFLFEEFAQDPRKITTAVFKILGVDDTFLPDTSTRYKSTGVPRKGLWARFLIHDNVARKLYRSSLPLKWRARFSATGWLARMRDHNLTKPVLSPDTRHHLEELYTSDLRKLRTVTGLRFEEWW